MGVLKPYRIGYRTVKTALGMTLAIIIAQYLDILNFASAGILVALCIKSSRTKSYEAAFSRLIACVVGMTLSFILFELIGYEPYALGIIILLYIPLTVSLNIEEGLVTAIVIIIHCFSFGEFTYNIFFQELLLLIIGIGIALLLNLYMPSMNNELLEYKASIEKKFKSFLIQLSNRLDHDDSIDQTLIDSLVEELKIAKTKAFIDVENHYVRNDNSFYYYFDMRENQLEILRHILLRIDEIKHHSEINRKLNKRCSEFIKEMAEMVSSTDYTSLRLHELYKLRLEVDEADLPQSTEELNERAMLIELLHDIEAYLKIKSTFGNLEYK